MQIERKFGKRKVVSQLLLLALPTAVIAYFLLSGLADYFNFLQEESLKNTIYFSAGLVFSFLFFGYRFRFATTTLGVFTVLFFLYKITEKVVVGEFNTFFASLELLVFILLFVSGWTIAYGLARSKYFTLFFAIAVLFSRMLLLSKGTDFNLNGLFNSFAPFLLYSVYLIYVSELLRNFKASQPHVFSFLSKRFLGFATILILVLLFVGSRFEKDFQALEKQWNTGSYNTGKNESMTQRNPDGSISNKKQTQLSGSLNKGKQLVFVARLDNFFADGETPNPLYFTSYYYTKYDTVTQTFQSDSLMPSNDLFKPDPSKISLFFNVTDSSKILHSKGYLARKVVTADIYKVALSPNEFLAPSTAFYCQPIQVPEDYKKEYTSAYKAKMWVSDLNSAYFIYNPGNNKQLQEFQETRFEELRKLLSWENTDPDFLKYYTKMPVTADFDSIRRLTQQITDSENAPIDKIIAIRNYFTSKDQWGQPLYTYSDNPGIPGIPSANKLNYFLFTNRKGYCSYFAGATLFMLRSIGIPSRIAAGFLTIDRSTKNAGWYWFYQDQAHAWVQVYFPGYGWIDFDTTIPDENTREAPQPDQTPPLNMPQAYFVVDGKVQSVDSIKKEITIEANRFLIKDQESESEKMEKMLLDVSIANISNDTGLVSISYIKKGMHITAASYSEKLKDLAVTEGEDIQNILQSVKQPVTVDEVKVHSSQKPDEQKNSSQAPSDKLNLEKIFWKALIMVGGFLLLLFSIPYLIYLFYNFKARSSSNLPGKKAYAIHRAILFYLNQLNLNNNRISPDSFAREMDQQFNTSYYRFHNIYQQLKYSHTAIHKSEEDFLNSFYPEFIRNIKGAIPFKTRVSKFLNLKNTFTYFNGRK